MDGCSSPAFSQLHAEGCEIGRSEKVPGASRDGRAELATVLDFLRLGDTLVVTRRDRLGHRARPALVDARRDGPSDLVLTVLGVVAQMIGHGWQRHLILQACRSGTPAQPLRDHGEARAQIGRAVGASRPGGAVFVLEGDRAEDDVHQHAGGDVRVRQGDS